MLPRNCGGRCPGWKPTGLNNGGADGAGERGVHGNKREQSGAGSPAGVCIFSQDTSIFEAVEKDLAEPDELAAGEGEEKHGGVSRWERCHGVSTGARGGLWPLPSSSPLADGTKACGVGLHSG